MQTIFGQEEMALRLAEVLVCDALLCEDKVTFVQFKISHAPIFLVYNSTKICAYVCN